jgi:hypothetical protein
MNNFEKPFNQQDRNWEKGTRELSKFFLDKLDHKYFLSWLRREELEGESDDEDKVIRDTYKRWNIRLEELLAKAQERIGYKIDKEKMIASAYQQILNSRESGELGDSKEINRLCQEIEELLEKVA